MLECSLIIMQKEKMMNTINIYWTDNIYNRNWNKST